MEGGAKLQSAYMKPNQTRPPDKKCKTNPKERVKIEKIWTERANGKKQSDQTGSTNQNGIVCEKKGEIKLGQIQGGRLDEAKAKQKTNPKEKGKLRRSEAKMTQSRNRSGIVWEKKEEIELGRIQDQAGWLYERGIKLDWVSSITLDVNIFDDIVI